MKSTSSNAVSSTPPLVEYGPRALVPVDERGCNGCVHYIEGWCTADSNGKDPPFWVHIEGRTRRKCSPEEGGSCAMWEHAKDGKPKSDELTETDNEECKNGQS